MSDFAIGDYVECIDSSEKTYIHKHHIYRIRDMRTYSTIGFHICIDNPAGLFFYKAKRFKLFYSGTDKCRTCKKYYTHVSDVNSCSNSGCGGLQSGYVAYEPVTNMLELKGCHNCISSRDNKCVKDLSTIKCSDIERQKWTLRIKACVSCIIMSGCCNCARDSFSLWRQVHRNNIEANEIPMQPEIKQVSITDKYNGLQPVSCIDIEKLNPCKGEFIRFITLAFKDGYKLDTVLPFQNLIRYASECTGGINWCIEKGLIKKIDKKYGRGTHGYIDGVPFIIQESPEVQGIGLNYFKRGRSFNAGITYSGCLFFANYKTGESISDKMWKGEKTKEELIVIANVVCKKEINANNFKIDNKIFKT